MIGGICFVVAEAVSSGESYTSNIVFGDAV